jgi:DNA-binding CsgD family transcriptional regulator
MLKEKIIKLRKNGLSYKQIESELRCARSTIQYHCKNEGLNENLSQPNRLNDKLILKIKEEYRTRTAKQIAEKYEISKNVVYKYCKNINKRIIVKQHSIVCEYCGKTHLTHTGDIKFCSLQCKTDYHRNLMVEKWLNGEHDGMRGKTSTVRWIKWYLIQKHGEKCMECGWSKRNEYTGKIPIELEHIDGDFRNNKEENLKLLCPNCHSLTPTYKSLNIGKGRPRK